MIQSETLLERTPAKDVAGSTIACYVSYSLPTKIITTGILRPIHAGRAASAFDLQMPGDDTGCNISDKNALYCELTAHYWIWKNDLTTDFIGLFHYRRFFDLTFAEKSLNTAGVIAEPEFSLETLQAYGLNQNNIHDKMVGYDGIVPAAFDVRRLGLVSVREQYSLTPGHDMAHLQIVAEVLKQRDPVFLPFYDQALSQSELFANNIFIFRRPLFESYSAWLFPILLDIEQHLIISGTPPLMRVIGYLAERLFTAYILKLRAEGIYRLRYANRVLFTKVGMESDVAISSQFRSLRKLLWSILPFAVRPAIFKFLRRPSGWRQMTRVSVNPKTGA